MGFTAYIGHKFGIVWDYYSDRNFIIYFVLR